jgi:hypothetical protein
MELLRAINLEQLGVAGILIAFLVYQNFQLRKDAREEREYSREILSKYQDLAEKTISTIGRLENAFTLLKDALK